MRRRKGYDLIRSEHVLHGDDLYTKSNRLVLADQLMLYCFAFPSLLLWSDIV